MKLMDSLSDIIPAVKFQSAYYELLGPAGAITLQQSMAYAKSLGMAVILDAKRNDIGSTAKAYAEAYLGNTHYNADALTVNGYLGTDGIKPFVEICRNKGKGIFILVKTSNPSSGELQDLSLAGGMTVYEKMAQLVNGWGSDIIGEHGYSSIGAVAGATYPEELRQLRDIMPKAMLLVPGYGAQGGGAEDVKHGFDKKGNGAIVNSSRGLMCAWKSEKFSGRYTHEDFCEAARAEAIQMKKALADAIICKNNK
jgi:orotidine-5'-phosphate decarboxylase